MVVGTRSAARARVRRPRRLTTFRSARPRETTGGRRARRRAGRAGRAPSACGARSRAWSTTRCATRARGPTTSKGAGVRALRVRVGDRVRGRRDVVPVAGLRRVVRRRHRVEGGAVRAHGRRHGPDARGPRAGARALQLQPLRGPRAAQRAGVLGRGGCNFATSRGVVRATRSAARPARSRGASAASTRAARDGRAERGRPAGRQRRRRLAARGHAPRRLESASTTTCEFRWETSPWRPCPDGCGHMAQTRQVGCVRGRAKPSWRASRTFPGRWPGRRWRGGPPWIWPSARSSSAWPITPSRARRRRPGPAARPASSCT